MYRSSFEMNIMQDSYISVTHWFHCCGIHQKPPFCHPLLWFKFSNMIYTVDISTIVEGKLGLDASLRLLSFVLSCSDR